MKKLYENFKNKFKSKFRINSYKMIMIPLGINLIYFLDKKSENKIILQTENNLKQISKRDYKNLTKFIIIGGGPAGISCAETLRQTGFTGEIQVFTEEPLIPYDRTQLSKGIIQDFNKLKLKDEKFLKEFDIDVISNVKVVAIDNIENIIKLSNGQIKNYDKLLIATGASSKIPIIQGHNLNNVFTLRNYFDYIKIKQAAINSKRIVIVGASFIGMEMASTLKQINPMAEIIIIERKSFPFQNLVGRDLGNILKNLFEEKGIKFILESEVESLYPNNNSVNVNKVGYKIINNENINNNDVNYIQADMVLLGTGIDPNIDILDQVVLLENNFVKCDSNLNTSDNNIFAAGDVVSCPQNGERIISQHYNNAQQQGTAAALNMLGKNIIYDYVNMFSIKFFNKSIQFVGQFNKFDEIIFEQNILNDNLKFVAFYVRNNRVIGVASMNYPDDFTNIMHEIFRQNYYLSGSSIRNNEINLEHLIKIKRKLL